VLSNGEAVFSGDPARGIESYIKSVDASDQIARRSLGTGEATIHRFSVLDEHGATTSECQYAQPYRLSIDLTVSPAFPEYDISITFMSRSQELVAQCHSGANRYRCRHSGERHRVEIAFDAQLLNPGRYWINVVVFDPSATRHLCWELAVTSLNVIGTFVGNAPVQLVGSWKTTPITMAGPAPASESWAARPKAVS
jgi:Wzt C-terminal domain